MEQIFNLIKKKLRNFMFLNFIKIKKLIINTYNNYLKINIVRPNILFKQAYTYYVVLYTVLVEILLLFGTIRYFSSIEDW